MGCKRTEPKIRIKPISDKQAIKNKLWNEITNRVCFELGNICQYCGKRGQRLDPEVWDYLVGHHMVSRARGGDYAKENCYICHKICHSTITDKNIQVAIGDYKTRSLFY
jgi:5-methylcytosine-specific restriction endonuclease McrA